MCTDDQIKLGVFNNILQCGRNILPFSIEPFGDVVNPEGRDSMEFGTKRGIAITSMQSGWVHKAVNKSRLILQYLHDHQKHQ